MIRHVTFGYLISMMSSCTNITAAAKVTNIPWAGRLSWLKIPIHIHFLAGDFYPQSRQTVLVFGMWPRFISRSVHARLQVSMQHLWSMPPWLTSRHTHTQAHNICPAYVNSSDNWAKKSNLPYRTKQIYQHHQLHHSHDFILVLAKPMHCES